MKLTEITDSEHPLVMQVVQNLLTKGETLYIDVRVNFADSEKDPIKISNLTQGRVEKFVLAYQKVHSLTLHPDRCFFTTPNGSWVSCTYEKMDALLTVKKENSYFMLTNSHTHVPLTY